MHIATTRSYMQPRAASVPGTGTITQSGTTITGVNTLFTTECAMGDRIVGGDISGRITSVTNDGVMDLDSSATVAVGVSFDIYPG